MDDEKTENRVFPQKFTDQGVACTFVLHSSLATFDKDRGGTTLIFTACRVFTPKAGFPAFSPPQTYQIKYQEY